MESFFDRYEQGAFDENKSLIVSTLSTTEQAIEQLSLLSLLLPFLLNAVKKISVTS